MSTEQKVDGLTPADGGPAFPKLESMEQGDYGRFHAHTTGGMSLLDYFAAKAQGVAAKIAEDMTLESIAKVVGVPSGEYTWRKHYPLAVAILAYEQADAMMKARARSEVPETREEYHSRRGEI